MASQEAANKVRDGKRICYIINDAASTASAQTIECGNRNYSCVELERVDSARSPPFGSKSTKNQSISKMDSKLAYSSTMERLASETISIPAVPENEGINFRVFSRALVAEALGTFFIVIFGVGSVVAAVTTGAQSGIWQVAVVWGFGVTLAIMTTAKVSGAHLNPAVTLAFLLVRPESFGTNTRVNWIKAGLYMLAQMIGGILGGLVNLGVFGETIAAFERAQGIERGQKGSELSAMVFGEYFPNPGFVNENFGPGDVSPIQACLIEGWGTLILCFVIFSLTHEKNKILGADKDGEVRPMLPFFIGFTVSTLISLYAPLTQAGWNPARDFGPRIVAACAGWGWIAIPGPRSGFWVYIVGPMIGGPIGAALADFFNNTSM